MYKCKLIQILFASLTLFLPLMLCVLFQPEKMNLPMEKKIEDHEVEEIIKEKDSRNAEIADLKQELENARKAHQEYCSQIEASARKTQQDLEKKLKEFEDHLNESKKNVQELEAKSRSKSQWWNKKEHIYKTFTEFQLGALKVYYYYYYYVTSLKQRLLRLIF